VTSEFGLPFLEHFPSLAANTGLSSAIFKHVMEDATRCADRFVSEDQDAVELFFVVS
jgi:hypothetical protein